MILPNAVTKGREGVDYDAPQGCATRAGVLALWDILVKGLAITTSGAQLNPSHEIDRPRTPVCLA
eukprot:538156-Prymnesium_polylepis.2